MRWIELDFEDEAVELPRGASMLLGLDGGPRRRRDVPLFQPGSVEKLSGPCLAGHLGANFLERAIEEVHRDAHRYRIWLLWSSEKPWVVAGSAPPYRVDSNEGILGLAVMRWDGQDKLPELAVLCAQRGYGSFLLGEARRFAREAWGATRMRVDAVRESRKFYMRHGFTWVRALGRGVYVPMIGSTSFEKK